MLKIATVLCQPTVLPNYVWQLLACLTALVLCGCATPLPSNVDRPVSQALSTPQETALGNLARRGRPANIPASHSGFVLMAGPEAAYASRLGLVLAAQKTLDLQYYAIHADASTAKLLRQIVSAARRGVRVRVLLDDFHSTGPDAQVMRLAFEPNIEMRMFNPLAGSRRSMLGRSFSMLTDFQRAQQRMHNKMFVADNAMAVVGGRNLGDEYFNASDHGNFVDVDVLVAGPVVPGLSQSFDSYWNNPRAYPVQSLIKDSELKELQAQFRKEDSEQPLQSGAAAPEAVTPSAPTTSPKDTKPHHAAPVLAEHGLNLHKVPWIWAPAAVLADAPTKIPLDSSVAGDTAPAPGAEAVTATMPVADSVVSGSVSRASGSSNTSKPETLAIAPRNTPRNARTEAVLGASSVVDGLLALIRTAKRDLVIVSPYFVPGDQIMNAFSEARQRGVRVRVLTNSLASNDAPLAHAGYAHHRKQLLGIGVELYEMLSTSSNVRSMLHSGSGGLSGSNGASKAMLHSKLMVVDGFVVAIGSMNLDMRSQYQNTEIAVLVVSQELGRQAGNLVNQGMNVDAWNVVLDADGKLLWRAPKNSGRDDQGTEPDASLPLRMMLQIIGPLAPDSLL